MSSSLPAPGGAAVPPTSSSPVYLEFRHLSVALKTRLTAIEKAALKPPPIVTACTRTRVLPPPPPPVIVQSSSASSGIASTMSPPLLSSHSYSPTLVSPAISTPGPRSAKQWLQFPLAAVHEDDDIGIGIGLNARDLPSPPEFSFVRDGANARRGDDAEQYQHGVRGPASEPARLRSSEREGAPVDVDADDLIDVPVNIFLPPPPPTGVSSPLPLEPLQYASVASDAAGDGGSSSSSKLPKKLILNDISGYALPGQVTAIMGCSGAGKTTLLNVLSGRHSSSTSRLSAGAILLNGREIASYSSLSRASAFVQQNDLLLPSLTVHESILFAAMMKLPESVPHEEKVRRVRRVIEELGLKKCEHFRIGSSGAGDSDSGGSSSGGGGGGSSSAPAAAADPNDGAGAAGGASKTGSGVARSGISGGEQRRVSIGMELVTDPQLLFLDEPTSGLDSSTAYTIVALLKRLASARGCTILLTIHSPSSKIFRLFDRLILLTPHRNGAKVAYQGPAAAVMDYFDTRLVLGLEMLCHQLGKESALITMSDYLMMLLERKNKKALRHDVVIEVEERQRQRLLLKAGGDGAVEDVFDIDAEVERRFDADQARIDAIVEQYERTPDVMSDDLLALAANAERASHDDGAGDPAVAANNGVGGNGGAGGILTDFKSIFHPGSEHAISWLQQFRHLTYRSYLTHVREITNLKARVFTNLFLALFVGLLYLSTSKASTSSNYNQRSIFNRVGFIFFVTCMQALITLVNSVLTFTEERALFVREKSSRMYATSAYFLSKMVLELPLDTALSCLFGAIGYAMTGMTNDAPHFLKFLFLLALLGHTIASVGLLLGACVPIPILGVMLCLENGTLVRMYDGTTKRIEQISMNDTLVGTHGQPVRLTQRPTFGDGQPMYTITHDDGTSYTVTAGHQVTLVFNRQSYFTVQRMHQSTPSVTLVWYEWRDGRPVLCTRSKGYLPLDHDMPSTLKAPLRIDWVTRTAAMRAATSLWASLPDGKLYEHGDRIEVRDGDVHRGSFSWGNGVLVGWSLDKVKQYLMIELQTRRPLHDSSTGAAPRDGTRLELGTMFEMRADVLYAERHSLINGDGARNIVFGYRVPRTASLSEAEPTLARVATDQCGRIDQALSTASLSIDSVAHSNRLANAVRIKSVDSVAARQFTSIEVDGDHRFQLADGTLTHNCPVTVIPFMLTSGFFLNLDTIPSYLTWLTVISPHRYTFAGLMAIEFDELKLHCDEAEVATVVLNPDSLTAEAFRYCQMIKGRQVLHLLSLPYNEYWFDVQSLVIIAIVFRVAAFLVLEATVRENRLKLADFCRRTIKRCQRAFRRLIDKCRGEKQQRQQRPQSARLQSTR